MHRFLIALFAIIALAALGDFPTATGQTIPSPIYLPLIYGAAPSTITPTSIPTILPTTTPTATNTPSQTPTRTPSSTATNTPTPQPAGNIDIRNTSAFVPYEGSDGLYVVGEVINNTTGNVWLVKINVVLRDAGGTIVTGENGYSLISTLAPGMVSPFRVLFFDVPDWSTYELTVTSDNTNDGPVALELTNIETYFDSGDAFHTRGNVRNQTGENREFSRVFVTLYDSADTVIGTDYQYTNPTDLAPGQQVLFDVNVYFWNGKPDHSRIASYSVVAFDD